MTRRRKSKEVATEKETEGQDESVDLIQDLEGDFKSGALKIWNATKSHSVDVGTHISDLSPDRLEKLWNILKDNISPFVATLLSDAPGPSDVEDAKAIISCATSLANATITTQITPEALTQVVLLISGVLTAVPECLRNGISQLCEQWYIKDLPEKESIATTTLIFLLQRTLSDKANKSDIKRLWAIHPLVLEHFSDTSLKRLLLRTAQSHLFLKCAEGIRFVVFLFTLSPNFIESLHQSIKQVIPGCPKQVALTYGEIYYKAWSNSAGSFREKLEDGCIQDLMSRGVVANRNLSNGVLPPILNILEHFHKQKNSRPTQALVYRLWEPILWRHLKVANGNVRANAAEFLCQGFPLEDPNQEIEERARKQELQLTLLTQLLKDDVVLVRLVTIRGIGRILASYWVILPMDKIKAIMKILITELAFDASSAKVRSTTIQALRTVLTNERTHLYFKKVLPLLSDCLHDINEGVRSSMMDLLLDIRAIRTIHFWDVSPLEHLLARLSVDPPSSCGKIVQLLSNSFFPLDQSENAKIERCAFLVEKNRIAARRFYQTLGKTMKLHDCVKFMLALLLMIRRHVRSQLPSGSEESEDDEDKENSSENKKQKLDDSQAKSDMNESTVEPTEYEALKNPEIVTGFLDVVCILWTVKCTELAEQEGDQYRAFLENKASKLLPMFFKFYKSDDLCRPGIVYLCSFLPHSRTSTVAGFCLSRLRAFDTALDPTEMDVDAFAKDPLSTYVGALCNWRRGNELIEIIHEWIAEGLASFEKTKSPKKKRKYVRFSQPPSDRKCAALLIIKHILRHPFNKANLLRKNRAQLEGLRDILREVLPLIDSRIISPTPNLEASDQVFLVAAYEVLLKLDTVLYIKHPSASLDALIEDLTWPKREVISRIGEFEMVHHVLDKVILIASNLVTLDITDEGVIKGAIELVEGILQFVAANGTPGSFTLISQCGLFISELTEWSVSNRRQQTLETNIPNLVGTMLAAVHKLHESDDDDDDSNSDAFRSRMVGVLDKFRIKFARTDPESYQDIIQVFVTATLAMAAASLRKTLSLSIPATIGSLPPMVRVLLHTINAKAVFIQDFVKKLEESVCEVEDIYGIGSALAIVGTLAKDPTTKVKKADMKGCILELEQRLPRGREANDENVIEDQILLEVNHELAELKDLLSIVQ